MTPSEPSAADERAVASPIGAADRRLHPYTLLFATLGLARQLIFPAAIGGLSRADGDPGRLVGWALAILAIPAVIIAALRYATFRYRVTGDELVIDSGVLQRQHRVIPLAHVQNIDLRESALQRACGVVELHVETAGSGRSAEASLEVLGRADAEALREELLTRRRAARLAGRPATEAVRGDGAAEGGEARPRGGGGETSDVLVRLTTARLALAGATANEAGLIAAAVGAGLQLVDDFALGRVIPVDALIARLAGSSVAAALWLLLLTLAAVFVLGWVVSVVGSVIGYHDFTLERVGGDLRKRYGLLGRRHTSIPLERVQGLRIEESLLRRPLGLATLKIETAGGSPGGQRRRGAEAFVPIARTGEVPALLRGVFDDLDVGAAHFHRVHPRARRRAFLRHLFAAVVVLTLASAMALLRTGALPRGMLWWTLALGTGAYGLAAWQYRHRGWSMLPDYVLARTGVLNRITWVVPHAKIQTLHVASTPFQRRHGLATLIIDTASGGRQSRVVDLAEETARELMATLAAKARSTNRRNRPKRE